MLLGGDSMKKILSILMVMLFIVSMMLPFAAGDDSFTPSVEKKEAPELVEKEYTNPSTGSSIRYVADILFNHDEMEIDIDRVPVPDVWVTAYGEKDAASETVKTDLEIAYEEVSRVSSFTELNPDIERVVHEINPKADVDSLVAYELFDLTLSDEYMELLLESGNNMARFTMDIGLRPDEPAPIVMHRSKTSGKWLVVEPKYVKNNGDGTVTIDFFELCPVIFLRVTAETSGGSEGFRISLLTIILLLLILILLLIILHLAISLRKAKKRLEKAEEALKNAEENAGNPATEEKTEPDQQN